MVPPFTEQLQKQGGLVAVVLAQRCEGDGNLVHGLVIAMQDSWLHAMPERQRECRQFDKL